MKTSIRRPGRSSSPAGDRDRKSAHNDTTRTAAAKVNRDWSLAAIPLLPANPGRFQAKLEVGSPSDPLERQADAAAEQVAGGRLQRKCTACAQEEEDKSKVARKESAAGAGTGAAPAVVHHVLREPGAPLDPSARGFFEPRFGRDFSSVRIHNSPAAGESARSVQALAYTVGRDIVFAEGQYDPASDAGRKLLAHELAHTVQQSAAGPLVQRQPGPPDNPQAPDDTIDVDLVAVSPEETEELRKRGINLPTVSQETFEKLPPAPPAILPATVPSGFTSAASGAASCPAAPQATSIPANCPAPAVVAGTAPPKKEAAALPPLDETDFGGDPVVGKFAGDLADCHAERVVDAEISKRFKAAVEGAKKTATAEAKADTEKAITEATAGIDPKDKKALSAAKKKASDDAKAAAQKKIAAAQAAVTREDRDKVKIELSAAFKDELKTDYQDTMHAAVRRFGPGWIAHMVAAQNREKARLTKEKNAKPKVKKGETPPPAPSTDEINAEIEAGLSAVRCEQQNWAANQIEQVKRGWMVGRREKVDFDTITQQVKELKGFAPGRAVPESDRVPIPAGIGDPSDPGVAPEVADFLTSLQGLEPHFHAGNYAGHGGGSWAGAGFSVDLTLTGKDAELDDRGFYKHDAAVRFLLNLNQVVNAMGGQWRVLYNDFGVAEEVNHATGTRNVTYIGNNPKGTLNWHGPAPMVLHFHLDIQLPPPAAKPAAAQPSPQPPGPPPPGP